MKLSWTRWRRDLLAVLVGAAIASGVFAVILHRMYETHQVQAAAWNEKIDQARREAEESLKAAFQAEMALLRSQRPSTSGPLRGISEPQ